MRIFFDAARELGLERHVGARAKAIGDDRFSFLEAGAAAVDRIAFEYGPGNSWWHGAGDRPHCSHASLEAIGRIVLAGLPDLERHAAAGPER